MILFILAAMLFFIVPDSRAGRPEEAVVPDGVAHAASPLSRRDSRFMEGRWRADGEDQIYQFVGNESGNLLMKAHMGDGVIIVPVYLTKHDNSMHMGYSSDETNVPRDNPAGRFMRSSHCYYPLRIAMDGNVLVWSAISDELTRKGNRWIHRDPAMSEQSLLFPVRHEQGGSGTA